MIELYEEEHRKTRAMLVGNPGDNLRELKGLVDTLGMEVVELFNLNKIDIQPAFGMGSGKAQEISSHAKAINADCIIFDYELDPTKQRNWEKLCGFPVFDRQEAILRIFAQRALTKEAVLQVELARLEYSLPRLSHMYGEFSRQRGGNYGSKGSGETQLELDRRGVREKIFTLKKELEKVVQNRNVQRRRRDKSKIKTVALCGYTNAGKSSLMNALTNSGAFVENKLFATLDPLTRKLFLQNPEYSSTQDFSAQNVKSGIEILLTDTVGFISNLPHSLVNAFRSTLEESAYADLQLIVLDASDADVFLHYETIKKVLSEIDADNNKNIIVLNKIDNLLDDNFDKHLDENPAAAKFELLDKNNLQNENLEKSESEILQEKMSRQFWLTRVEKEFPNHIKVSAKTGLGIEELKNLLYKNLSM